MKATLHGIELEGTPSEIAEVIAALRAGLPITETLTPEALHVSEQASQSSVSLIVARRVLQRKPLSESQTKLLSFMASKHPSGVTYEDLQNALKLASGQLAGVLGGFKLRVTTTPGYVAGTEFLGWCWDDHTGGYKYYLTTAAVEAIGEVKLAQ